ncbi:MAG: autotransporter-associated beta strand repeat-containing protein, partial [Candidatus Omnitrophota bacterium]
MIRLDRNFPLLFLATFVLMFAFVAPARAGSFDVLNTGDAGADTLRQAITDLNTSAENGTIVFGSGAEGTITLGSALPTLNYETIFDLSDYEVSLSGYSGGTAAEKWFKLDTTGSGTLILRECTWSVGAGMVVGDNNNGNLTITDSSAFSTAYSSYIGSANDSNGAVLVDSDATWTSSEDIYIGSGGVGTLYISGGADVSSRSGIIAGYSGGDGTVTVTGAGSTWTNTNGLTIANAGPGGLNISDGGTVSDDWSDVGNAGVGTVNVDGAGSAWNNTGDLNIGKANDGFLTVSNGGAVTGNHIYAAKDAGSHAGIYVGDTGSTLTAGTDLTIGNSGAAEIVVYDGATVTVNGGAGTITLGKNADSEGLLVIGREGGGTAGTVNAAEITSGSGTANIVFGQNDDHTFSPVISGSISVQHKGSGMTTLSGNNTYTGSTSIQSGTIKLGNDSALGTQDEGTTVDEGASLDLNGHDLFSASEDEPLTIAGSGTGGEGALFNSTAGMSTYSGSITLTAASTIGVTDAAGSMLIYRDINTGAAGYDITFDGDGDFLLVNTMTGKITGNGNVIKNGAGEMLLYMTGDNYTGSTAINEGKFTLGGSEVIPDTSAVTIASGAELDLNGKDETIGSLAGAGNVINRSTACTLTAGGDGSSTTFSGVISDGTGATSFTKEGAGTLILTGTSTYSGDTAINNGILRVENANAVGTGALTNDAALDVGSISLTVNGVYSQNAGSSLAVVASSASSYGNISSASNAFVDAGSSVNVTVSGFLPKNSRLKIIDGTGGAGVGIPGTITSNNSRLRFSAVSSDGDLFLVVDRSTAGFASVSSNPNIAAVGAALDNITAPSGDMLTVLNSLELMDDSGVASDLGTFAPVVDGGVLNVSNSSFNQFIGTSNARLSDLFAQAREAEETGISAGSEGFSG